MTETTVVEQGEADLHVVEEQCRVAGRQGTLVLESGDRTLVSQRDAKQFAIAEAARRGMARPGISKMSGAYAVDAEGNIAQLGSGAAANGDLRYRCDFEMTEGI